MSEEVKNKAEANDRSTSLEPLSTKLDLLSLKLEKLEVTAGIPAKEKQSWWSVATQFLGLPALIILMILQLSQTKQTTYDTDKSVAEAAKIRTEELKTRAELQELLDKLAEKKAIGLATYQQQLNETLPKLEQTIAKLSEFNRADTQRTNMNLFSKYLILWIFLYAVSLFFEIISTLWASFITIFTATVYSREYTKDSKFQKRLRKYTQLFVPILSPLPQILRLAVNAFLLFAVLAPFFNQQSGLLGSQLTFDSIIDSLKHLSIGGAVEKIRQILFS
ncbi:MAG TPA: hypothetical protein VGW12_17610 [Pyrinomonadaceae bacterium]|nr:hypothetical protein [Pyrinomonadaceae bacterium]